ncbi:MAG TPA: 50S ribosomal L9 C-terminal domain-containing protein [Anaerolineales bacterium]|nr:50S ribosomal L9 C-terminal domain-containing protein [Anaerolineales bacterium]
MPAGALKQVEKIRSQAEIRRTELNSELKDLATQIGAVVLNFPAKAGETGKLYGSITTQDVATAIQEQTRYEVKKQQIDMQPIRNLGEFKARVRLTMDLVPEVKVIVYREGEAREEGAEESTEAEAPVETSAEAAEATAS